VMSHTSGWLTRFACFDQCIETEEDTWPALGTGSTGRIIFRPLVVFDGNPGGFALWHKVDRLVW
jgi:hypothetical protein